MHKVLSKNALNLIMRTIKLYHSLHKRAHQLSSYLDKIVNKYINNRLRVFNLV